MIPCADRNTQGTLAHSSTSSLRTFLTHRPPCPPSRALRTARPTPYAAVGPTIMAKAGPRLGWKGASISREPYLMRAAPGGG